MKHQDDCVYPQTELWPLCTCPRVNPKPLVSAPHDPLCDEYAESVENYCTCALIGKVRIRIAEDIIGMLSMNTLVSLTIHGEDRKFMNSMIRSAARSE